MAQEIPEADEIGDLEAIVDPLLAADREHWDKLEAYLAKDMSRHGRWWQYVMKEVRKAIEANGMMSEQ